MRLICPNCNAQYDVSDEMIPADGRDVQCSNCATTWFQEGRRQTAAPAPEPVVAPDVVEQAAPPPVPDVTVPTSEEAKAPQPRRRPMADDKTLDILRQERAHEARKRAAERRRRPAAAPMPEAASSEVEAPLADDGRAAAAAERERMAAAASVARARQAEAPAPETIPDPATDPLPVAPPPDPQAPDAVRPPAEPARMMAPSRSVAPEPEEDDGVADAIASVMRDAEQDRGDDDGLDGAGAEPALSAAAARLARRDLLPDIEEINSSLRPDERLLEAEAARAAEETPAQAARARSGFGIGFGTIVFVVLAAVVLYVFAAPLAARVPALADPLISYASWIDGVRAGLDGWIDGLTTAILSEQG